MTETTSTPSSELGRLIDNIRPALDALNQMITIVDSGGRFVYYNQAAARMDGFDPEQVIGRHILEVNPWLNAADSTLLRCLGEQTSFTDSYQAYQGFGGQHLHYVHSVTPLYACDGALIGAMEIGRTVQEMPAAPGDSPQPPDILTVDPALKRLVAHIDIFGAADLPILIHGESGTGKELFARRAHAQSQRATRPMLSLNCAAIPDTLLESTLFGTTRGAFTGAENRKGLFALADGATLFLDEINSMPISLQGKLLRVLQDGSFLPLGSLQPQSVDVRLIAAINQSPQDAIAEGRLRGDLYYRLSVGEIGTIPLRERPGDILLLAQVFIAQFAPALRPQVVDLSDHAKAALTRHDWPGNVRELENLIRRSLLLHDGGPLLEQIAFSAGLPMAASHQADDLPGRLQQTEADSIRQALAACGGNASKAARRLGVPRSTLASKMKRLGIDE